MLMESATTASLLRELQKIERKLLFLESRAEELADLGVNIDDLRLEAEINAMQAIGGCPEIARAFAIAMQLEVDRLTAADGPDIMAKFRIWLRPGRVAGGTA